MVLAVALVADLSALVGQVERVGHAARLVEPVVGRVVPVAALVGFVVVLAGPVAVLVGPVAVVAGPAAVLAVPVAEGVEYPDR